MKNNIKKNETIAVIGLGYVGLPLAVEFGKKFKTIGYDKDNTRIRDLIKLKDKTRELSKNQIGKAKKLSVTSNVELLQEATVFIITVPTPLNSRNNPDLNPLKNAVKTVSKYIKNNSLIIFESTVYPGVTEEICVPLLEKYSKLKYNIDFFCGYSPERINPGDKKRTLTKIKKVVSGSDEKTKQRVNKIYKEIIKAGTHVADSIKIAEMAKVIENSQRDINIAFMNELALICKKLEVNTHDVIKAAKTKWNFLEFYPGLVGGHCISVDPYYLYYKSVKLGYNPKIILSGRKINDYMHKHILNEILTALNKKQLKRRPRVLLMGITFKENCPDIRNSQVLKIYKKLKGKNIFLNVFDPIADEELLKKNFKINTLKKPNKNFYDIILISVKHKLFIDLGLKKIRSFCNKDGSVFDLKGIFKKDKVEIHL
tara:strand:- start:3517 stop:4797 length:1281 start_codon:yes stop_codon:yes gene_type:complete